jgi:hypothetical protein
MSFYTPYPFPFSRIMLAHFCGWGPKKEKLHISQKLTILASCLARSMGRGSNFFLVFRIWLNRDEKVASKQGFPPSTCIFAASFFHSW